MLCCCERDEQTSSRIMSDYNIDLGEWGVSSVPALMAKIVGLVDHVCLDYFSFYGTRKVLAFQKLQVLLSTAIGLVTFTLFIEPVFISEVFGFGNFSESKISSGLKLSSTSSLVGCPIGLSFEPNYAFKWLTCATELTTLFAAEVQSLYVKLS